MIQELVNYAKWLKNDFPELFEGRISEGLHVLIDFTEEGEIESYKSYFVDKNTPESEVINNLKKRELISTALGDNKGIIDKVIFSNNPYAIFFKLYFTNSKNIENMLNIEELKSFKKKMKSNYQNQEISFDGVKTELIEKFVVKRLSNSVNNGKKSFSAYFMKIKEHYFDIEEDSIERVFFKNIQNYIETTLFDDILKDEEFIKMFLSLKKDNKTDISEIIIKEKYFDKLIKINFNVPIDIVEKASERYFSKNIFNIDTYNRQIDKKTFGLSNFFNKAAEDKKPFNLHKSSYFKTNNMMEINNAILMNDFLNASKFLPTILPIFIDKNELNDKVVRLFKKNDKKRGYKEIISEIAENNIQDLQNYYLLNFTRNDIKDMDFISNFKYNLKLKWNKDLTTLFCKKNPKVFFYNHTEQNIFQLEKIFNENFFYNKLSYFGNIKKTESTPDFLINNYYKYNVLLYDAFYKSRLQLITANIFKDICLPVIKHGIKHDETEFRNGNSESKFENRIIQKLLIYIQLNNLFDKENKNLGGIDMASELPKYHRNCLNLLTGKINNYESDEDFAFGTGQLIRYLLERSESSNKNHSMFTPFLQKLGNFDVFINQINRAIKAYGYRIKMNYDTVDKLVSNTTGYKLENGRTLKELETMLMCGYFAESVIDIRIKEIVEENKNKKTKDGGNNE